MSANYGDALLALVPTAQWTITDANDYNTIVWMSSDIQKPTKEACDAEIVALDQAAPLTACKNQASALLSQTDWTSIADVANPAVSNPYLMNQPDFLSYRSQVRQLAVYPVVNPVWPVMPTAQWSS